MRAQPRPQPAAGGGAPNPATKYDDGALAPLNAAFQSGLMSSAGLRIAGGTDEILKNIIAERVLGLPGDIRVDKDVPFKDMPTGR